MIRCLRSDVLEVSLPTAVYVMHNKLVPVDFTKDPSFQILHAVHSMERLLDDLKKRNAVFDIAFWHSPYTLLFHTSSPYADDPPHSDIRHATLKTGDSPFVTTSRKLARTLLYTHLKLNAEKMEVNVVTFKGLNDPAWDIYRRKTRVSSPSGRRHGGTDKCCGSRCS